MVGIFEEMGGRGVGVTGGQVKGGREKREKEEKREKGEGRERKEGKE